MSPFLQVMIGFTVANFGWQLFTGQDWFVATERSWFQCISVGYLWFAGFSR